MSEHKKQREIIANESPQVRRWSFFIPRIFGSVAKASISQAVLRAARGKHFAPPVQIEKQEKSH